MWIMVLFILVAILILLYDRHQKFYSKLPPGPKTVPILGNLKELGAGKLMYEYFTECSKEFPDFMTVWLGGHNPVIIINSYEAARKAFVENKHDFASRPDMVISKIFLRGEKDIFFAKYDAQWNAYKKLALQAMRKVVELPKLETEVNICCQEIIKQIYAVNGPVSLLPYISNIVFNVVASFSFGKRYKLDDPDYQRIVDLNKLSNDQFGKSTALEVIPGGTKIPEFIWRFVPLYKDLEKIVQQYLDFLDPLIAEHRATYSQGTIRDIVDAILLEQQAERQEAVTKSIAPLSDHELKLLILNIFQAGVDTTAWTLAWLFLHLTLNPDLQELCHDEILDCIGESRPPTLSDRSKMPFLEACILETMRLNPASPEGAPHATTNDVTIDDYFIPRNTTVMLNIYGIQRNEKYWSNPFRFDPTHFLDESGHIKKQQAFAPFGLGRRLCLGETLARNNLFLIAAVLLQRVKFCKIDEFTYSSTEKRDQDLVMIPPDYEVLVQPR